MLDGDKSDLTDDTDGAMDMGGRKVVGKSKSLARYGCLWQIADSGY